MLPLWACGNGTHGVCIVIIGDVGCARDGGHSVASDCDSASLCDAVEAREVVAVETAGCALVFRRCGGLNQASTGERVE